MEVDEELRSAERTGEVTLGANETLDATKEGNSRLTVLSASVPHEIEENILEYSKKEEVPVYRYPSGGKDLGLALGKPFSVSVLAVIDSGDSNVLELGGVESGD